MANRLPARPQEPSRRGRGRAASFVFWQAAMAIVRLGMVSWKSAAEGGLCFQLFFTGRTAMTIQFRCPECQKELSTPDDGAGKKARCSGCGTLVPIPDPSVHLWPPGLGPKPKSPPPAPQGTPPRRATPPPLPGAERRSASPWRRMPRPSLKRSLSPPRSLGKRRRRADRWTRGGGAPWRSIRWPRLKTRPTGRFSATSGRSTANRWPSPSRPNPRERRSSCPTTTNRRPVKPLSRTTRTSCAGRGKRCGVTATATPENQRGFGAIVPVSGLLAVAYSFLGMRPAS